MTPVRATRVRAQVCPEAITGVKVFSATMQAVREGLGEQATRWLAEHPECTVVDFVVVQSSDARFHCLTICIFYHAPSQRDERRSGPSH